jgi:eukaryotic-like serine/threonine-protein kinase
MGAVYAVIHATIGKRAALKVMHRRFATINSAERILLEARVVNQVGHPNIVDIFETGSLADGRPYIVMERLEGVALSQRVYDAKITPDQVIGILLQVCDALVAAHAAGIVHRDLKLDNIFLVDNPDDPHTARVKLLDWGIAKVIANDPHHTIEGQLVGTPQYLAPEQARGGKVSAATDVYSLGVMAYELFVQELPFQAETPAELMTMHLRATPPRPSELWPEMPCALEDLLLAMLAKAQDARPTVLTVARTLEAVRAELARHSVVPYPAVFARCSSKLPLRSELASTEPAGAAPPKRWQFVIGAFALAASVALCVVTRDHDSAAATTTAAPPTVTTIASTSGAADGSPTVPQAQLQLAAPCELAASDAVSTATHDSKLDLGAARPSGHHHHASHQIAPRKHPAKPRRDVMHDPDGTIEPY